MKVQIKIYYATQTRTQSRFIPINSHRFLPRGKNPSRRMTKSVINFPPHVEGSLATTDQCCSSTNKTMSQQIKTIRYAFASITTGMVLPLYLMNVPNVSKKENLPRGKNPAIFKICPI
jgi:hypothetical protein